MENYAVNKSDLRGIQILLYERDPLSARGLADDLRVTGARVVVASGFDEVVETLTKTETDVIVASLELVDEKCIELVKDYKARYPGSLFFVLADQEYDSVETSREEVRLIVDDYLKKPVDTERFAGMIQSSMGRPDDASKSLTVVDPIVSRVKPYFLLRSPVMKRALAHLPRIAASGQTVMITGETGTGKELVARVIHVMSRRSSGPFIPVNCGAVPESLIEGELFGHEKGAFTGAIRTRRGKFETADRGTIFLDEIGDMPLNLQVRLLRVLEEGRIYRIGAETSIPVDVRVIAASNVDLQKAVKDGLFREDLYYRLNVLKIHLPPLRERIEDIPLLAVHFLERAFAELGWPHPYPVLSAETIYVLERHRWRGNVRELRNVMTRVATLLPQGTRKIFPFHIVPHLEEDSFHVPPPQEEQKKDGIFIPIGTDLKKVEEILINETLRYTGGNRTRAAELLGVSVRNLRRKLNK
jgi:DNA-binding NtrC family response regulator